MDAGGTAQTMNAAFQPILVTLLSLLAGWLANVIADNAPRGRSAPWASVATWLEPVRRLVRRGEARPGQAPAWRYLLVWLCSLALGWLAYWRFGWSLAALVTAFYAVFFLAVAVIDQEHRRVLNNMMLAALPLILLLNYATRTVDLRSALVGGIFGFVVFLLIALIRPGGMGMGDVKLVGIIGLATGHAGVLVALFVGILAGGVAALALLLWTRFDRKATMAYAPYLVVGAWTAIYFRADLWSLFFNRIAQLAA
jgi:prepilin signal peptidase PulO-like enzyme (type II secretory pathway)